MLTEKYTSYFHDGALLGISHSKNSISISLESAEINLKNISSSLQLSVNRRLKGKLHIEGIKNVIENQKEFTEKLVKKSKYAEIMHLEIKKTKSV